MNRNDPTTKRWLDPDVWYKTNRECRAICAMTRTTKGRYSMRTDVVVIGGGAVGAAVAYFVKLLDPSTAVSVIERDPAYSQASTPQSSILAGR
jgi:hypothetical protein